VIAPDSPNANDANDGTDPIYPKLTLDGTNGAFAACTAGHHDTIVYVAGAAGLTMSGVLPWNKDYTHLVGVCAPTMVGQRARIFSPTTGVVSPLITVSATGCMFKDLYINHQSSNATAGVVVRILGGQRNFFENVHFCGPTNAAAAIDASASLQMGASASENTFLGCNIGSSTVVGGQKTGAMALVFEANAKAKRNVWKDCLFSMNPAHKDAGFIENMDASGVEDYAWFDNCVFINISTVMDSCFTFNGVDLTYKRFITSRCWGMGFTDWDEADTGYVYQSVYKDASGGVAGYLTPTIVA
jgi:hypothetical protein